MDIDTLKTKISNWIQKYKFVLLIIGIGLVLMLIPGKQEIPEEQSVFPAAKEEQCNPQDELAEILSHFAGAGAVRVYLSVASGEETLYQTDNQTSVTGESSSVQAETVILSGESGQTGLIRQENPPVYMGALILCQGADSPQIQLAIVDAVSKVTGLGADKIAVLKMK